MSFLVVLIVDDPDHCSPILDRWEEIGVTGVTILESTGLGRLRRAGFRDDLPMMPSLRDIFSSREIPHRTLLSVVSSQNEVDLMVEAAQETIGNLDDPSTGFLFVVPVIQAYGLGRKNNTNED